MQVSARVSVGVRGDRHSVSHSAADPSVLAAGLHRLFYREQNAGLAAEAQQSSETDVALAS